MRPPKADFRFLFYTPKKHTFPEKHVPFFNAYKVKKNTNINYRYKYLEDLFL